MLLWTHAAALVVSLAVGHTRGSGTIKEETRQVGDFSGVSVGSGIRATISIGPKTSVVLTGDDNLLSMIKLEVVDGKLTTRVDYNEGIHPSQPIRLTVVTPHLTSAEASGGASLTADATPGPKFLASASGASRGSLQSAHVQQQISHGPRGHAVRITKPPHDSHSP